MATGINLRRRRRGMNGRGASGEPKGVVPEMAVEGADLRRVEEEVEEGEEAWWSIPT